MAAVVALLCGSAWIYWVASGRGKPTDGQKGTGQVVKHDPAPLPAPKSPTPDSPVPAPLLANGEHSSSSDLPPNLVPDGVVTGQILFAGVMPQPQPIRGVNLMAECAKHHGAIYDESVVVNPNGTLANVVVSISDGLSGWLKEEFPPSAPAILDQKNCVFHPHVVAVMVGQPLVLKNSDPFLHNVHMLAVNNTPANVGQPTLSEAQTIPFESPEVFRVQCDVHPWMKAWVRVLDNPYFAVTGPDGRFTVHNLPPGTYTLKAWHEQLGVREQQITLTSGHGALADFIYKPVPQ